MSLLKIISARNNTYWYSKTRRSFWIFIFKRKYSKIAFLSFDNQFTFYLFYTNWKITLWSWTSNIHRDFIKFYNTQIDNSEKNYPFSIPLFFLGKKKLIDFHISKLLEKILLFHFRYRICCKKKSPKFCVLFCLVLVYIKPQEWHNQM